jgi:Zn-dependent peptidase ImmA (M78 family)
MKIRHLIFENSILDKPNILKDFLSYCKSELELETLPKIKLLKDKNYSIENKSFGGYSPDEKVIYLAIANRHPVDVLRTLAHELTHYKQDTLGQLDKPTVGETGSEEENEANAVAGIIMRNFGRANPEVFE